MPRNIQNGNDVTQHHCQSSLNTTSRESKYDKNRIALIYVPTTDYYQPVPGKFTHAVSQLLQTVNIDLQYIKNWGILDSRAKSFFLVTNAPVINISLTISALYV